MSCYAYEDVRYVRNRHHAECDGQDCAGCLPCPERHCPECAKGNHLNFGENTCPECIGRTRNDLRALVELHAALPAERRARGSLWSEAAMLAAPTANYEAWAYRRAAESNRTGITLNALGNDGDDSNPEWVLKQWVFLLCEDYLEEYDRTADVAPMADWIDARLARIANDVGQDFGQFKREIKRVRAHLEAVLHDGEQRDTGAPCMTCGVPLRRVWGVSDQHDGWMCPRCRQTSTEDQYRFAVQHLHREEATHLTDRDMEIRTGVKAGTVRVWANRGEVERRRDSGRTIYAVADVLAKVSGRKSA